MRRARLALLLSFPTIWLSAGLLAADDAVDFARDVRPILERHCFECHGRDMQEAGLRLDVRGRALQGGDRGAAIRHGDAGASLLIQLVVSDDEERRMPLGGEPLGEREIETLRRWIDAGADWPDAIAGDAQVDLDHWAFDPPSRPPLPAVTRTSWPRNPIDYFVLARLEAAGREPAPEADRHVLIRRLYLDLLGLPPPVDEADFFVNDARPGAYERLVDRLLASPRYGERWARKWLDLARYADTNGYEKDRVRSMWPYRDWVITAINRDQRFDQFTIQQLAGDMLPGASLDQRIATGFHRNTMINEEGGIDVEEFRFHSVVDRVHTTATVWLGLTLGCAQCHSHKYDPLTQREYYQFFAFLNNADEPEMPVSDLPVDLQRAQIHRQIETVRRDMQARFPRLEAAGRFSAWKETQRAASHRWSAARPSRLVSENHATLETLADGSVLVSGDNPNYDTYTVELPLAPGTVTAVRLDVLPHETLPAGGPGRAVFDSGAGAKGDFLLSETSFELTTAGAVPRRLAIEQATHSYALDGRSAALTIDGDLDTGWSVGGQTGRPHHIVYQLAQPLQLAEPSTLVVTLVQRYIHQMTIGRFLLSLTADDQPAVASGLPLEIEAALVLDAEQSSAQLNDQLRDYYLSVEPELSEQQQRIEKSLGELPQRTTTLVMQPRAAEHRRVTRIHHRGEFLKPTTAVEPDVPAVLHPLPTEVPQDRLTLARWLVDPANPLVARVVMNRHWQALFGRGLVRTTEDFGTQGAPPTHPQLLDWLAIEFARHHENAPSLAWSLKRMHRLLVTSATYRQSSHVSAEQQAADPDNTLLARGPRVRVDAEIVRDLALSVAGLLSTRIGGPSVFPPQAEDVTSLSYGQLQWETSTGEDRYRRGLYTFAKRTSPYASFAVFDAPSGETCTVRRERSNTPLQALTLLNDTVYLEAARGLAQRTIRECSPDVEERIERMFRACVTHPPAAEELAAVLAFYDRQLARLESGQLDAAAISGASQAGAEKGAVQLAAWTIVARAILNLDETITKE